MHVIWLSSAVCLPAEAHHSLSSNTPGAAWHIPFPGFSVSQKGRGVAGKGYGQLLNWPKSTAMAKITLLYHTIHGESYGVNSTESKILQAFFFIYMKKKSDSYTIKTMHISGQQRSYPKHAFTGTLIATHNLISGMYFVLTLFQECVLLLNARVSWNKFIYLHADMNMDMGVTLIWR